MEFITGPTETGMRASGICASNMAKEQIHLLTEIAIMASTRTVSLMVEVNIHGLKVSNTSENSSTAKSKAKEDGNLRRIRRIAIFTRENT